jgi:hypothetical protein
MDYFCKRNREHKRKNKLMTMNKSFSILLLVIALMASLFACEKTEEKKQLSIHPDYNWADSLILREGINAGDTMRSRFLIDSLEKTGDLNELGALTFRLITHQRFYHHNEIDAEVERLGRQIVTHNSLKDRKQWYYNYGASWLAYQLLCQGERCLRDGKGLGAEQELARVD